jgi:hypothetical protein
VHRHLCNTHGITRFPTFHYFVDGSTEPHVYNVSCLGAVQRTHLTAKSDLLQGGRSQHDLYDFMADAVFSAMHRIDLAEDGIEAPGRDMLGDSGPDSNNERKFQHDDHGHDEL